MAMKEIAVLGCTIDHASGSPVSGGTFVITTPPSIKCTAEGNGIYRGTIAFTFSLGTHSSGTPQSAVGAGSISFTATKNKADGQFVIRKEDTGTMNGTYVPPATPPPTVVFSSDVEITDAGQTSYSGE